MNSDARRLQSQFDTRGGSDLYRYYTEGQLRDWTTNPTVIITLVVLVVTIVYKTAYQQGRLPPLESLPQLLWDFSVFVLPARLLFAIDRLINPPLFPIPMLKTQTPTHAAKSEVLRKILGLDGTGGIIGSVSLVGRKSFHSLSNVALKKMAITDRPAGLGNYDNSCYQNSIIQGLVSLNPLPAYLSALSRERGSDLPPSQTVDELSQLLADLKDSTNNGRTLWTPMMLKNMNSLQQQDAQEYYSKLLDQIDKEMGKTALALQKKPGFESETANDDTSASQHSDDSGYHSLPGHSKSGLELRLARNPLEGLVAQRVACVACGYCEGLAMIPFNCLTLSLGDYSSHDVYERLDHYTKLEAIEGVECLKCTLLDIRKGLKALSERAEDIPGVRQRLQIVEETLDEESFDDEALARCKVPARSKVNATKTKQVAIARPPQSLVMHMNRSVFDERTGFLFKNTAAVKFPVNLDLGPWCLGSADGRANLKEGEFAVQDEEQWTLHPKLSMVAGDRQPSRIEGPMYELRAVIAHLGRHDSGHYVCYRRHSIPAASGKKAAEKPPQLASEKDVAADGTPDPEVDGESPSRESGTEKTPPAAQDEETQSPWWRFSDEDVEQVDESRVLNQSGVFMLFYDRVDPNSVLVSEREGDGCAGVEEAVQALSLDDGEDKAVDSPAVVEQEQDAVLDVDDKAADADADGKIGAGDQEPLVSTTVENDEEWVALPDYGNNGQ